MLDQIPGFRPQDRGTATTLAALTAKRRKAWVAAAFGSPVKDVSGSLREALLAPAGAAGVPAVFISPGITAHARFMAWRHHG